MNCKLITYLNPAYDEQKQEYLPPLPDAPETDIADNNEPETDRQDKPTEPNIEPEMIPYKNDNNKKQDKRPKIIFIEHKHYHSDSLKKLIILILIILISIFLIKKFNLLTKR